MTVADFVQLGMRLLLAAVFLVAGVAKLANRREIIQTLRDFGAPRRVEPFGILLPPVEVAVAAGFLFAATMLAASWGALALLGTFVAGIAANLARGRQPPCNCFGQLHSRPISWRTLLRNGFLASCAMYLIATAPPPAAADLRAFLGSLDGRGRRIATVVAAVIAFLILHALKQNEPESASATTGHPVSPAPPVQTTAALASRPEPAHAAPSAPAKVLTGNGLAVGTPAPAFVLPDLDGQEHSLDSLRAPGEPVLLVFSSPFCESCQALVPKLPALAASHEQALRLVLVSRGTVEQNLAKMKGRIPLPVLLQQDFEVAEAYDCTSTPAAVLISANGVVLSPLAVGGLAIQQLISSTTPPREPSHSRGAEAQPVPRA